jgi:hypothetical protein
MKIASQSSSAQELKSLTMSNLSPHAWIYHKSLKPQKEVLERAHKGFRVSIFVGGTSSLQMREGESFYTYPSKTSRWELASRNQNIRFWKPKHSKFEI